MFTAFTRLVPDYVRVESALVKAITSQPGVLITWTVIFSIFEIYIRFDFTVAIFTRQFKYFKSKSKIKTH